MALDNDDDDDDDDEMDYFHYFQYVLIERGINSSIYILTSIKIEIF